MTFKLPPDWKSSAAGILSGYLAMVGPVTAYLATTPNPTATKVVGAMTLAGAIARAWLGLIQKDAGTTMAQVSGATTVEPVPSHEVPDNPQAVAVAPVATFPQPKK